MEGIVAYGAYIPLNRLGPETKGWRGRTEKAVANFDEDSLTMGVAAAMDCLKGIDRSTVDAVYFASTTSPYAEKQAAATIVAAADLSREAFTSDFSNSLRASTIALRTALDAVRSGSSKRILVVASDLRIPGIDSAFEQVFGDGAVALLIGDTQVAAAIEDSCLVSDEIHDVWRAQDTAMHTGEDRFVFEKGYFDVLPRAVSRLMEDNSLNLKDFAKAAFYGPDARRHGDVGKKLGLEQAQVQDPMFTTMGNTGVAFALMILVSALEEASPGDRILLADYGNGASVFTLKVTESIRGIKDRRGISGHLKSKKILSDYQKYALWRGLVKATPAARRPEIPAPSTSALRRERDRVLSLHGSKCRNCGYPQYPPQRVCTRCHAKDNFEPYRFADKKASLFTFTSDLLADSLDPPLVMGLFDFEGGGRIKSVLADADINQLQIGAPIEMTFRKFNTAGGINHYFWKGMPSRG